MWRLEGELGSQPSSLNLDPKLLWRTYVSVTIALSARSDTTDAV